MIHAKYTIVLKNLLDDPAARAKIDQALSTYPLYVKKSKEEYIPAYIPTREELNAKILRYYKYREIGFETFGRFLDELECSMLEIMPKYNLLFMTADQDFNPIYNVDYKRTIDRTRNEDVTGESGTETASTATDTTTTTNTVGSDNKHVQSLTPQGQIGIVAKNIDTVTYADQVDWGKDNSSSNGSSTSNGNSTVSAHTGSEGNTKENENTLETTKGNFGVVSAQDLILKYRETIINIEQQIIEDPRIQELFMLVY